MKTALHPAHLRDLIDGLAEINALKAQHAALGERAATVKTRLSEKEKQSGELSAGRVELFDTLTSDRLEQLLSGDKVPMTAAKDVAARRARNEAIDIELRQISQDIELLRGEEERLAQQLASVAQHIEAARRAFHLDALLAYYEQWKVELRSLTERLLLPVQALKRQLSAGVPFHLSLDGQTIGWWDTSANAFRKVWPPESNLDEAVLDDVAHQVVLDVQEAAAADRRQTPRAANT